MLKNLLGNHLGTKLDAKLAQVDAKLVQDGPKTGQDGFKMGQDGPKMGQDGAKMNQDSPKMGPEYAKPGHGTEKVTTETHFWWSGGRVGRGVNPPQGSSSMALDA